MDTPSPALMDAFGFLQEDLGVHLEEAACLADQNDEWSPEDMDRARQLIGDLVYVLRALLLEHRLQDEGHCKICTAGWPCPVVNTIHAVVKDPERQFYALVERSHEDK